MWKVIVLSLLYFNIGFFQPELPTDVERIDLQLTKDKIAFTFLDLVNGESTLIQTATGENVLINTGAPESEEELTYYLDIYGVENITYIIITSPEPEYVGNLEHILQNYDVQKVITPENMADYNINNDNERVVWTKGEHTQIVKNLNAKVIQEGVSIEEHRGMDILFEFKGTNLLYMTSANKDVEEQLIKENNLSVVNIIKVGDFADKHGTSQPFLDSCDPQVAIIFKKEKNEGMVEVLERLHETWIDIYQTRQVGNVTIKMKEKDYQVFTLTLDSFHQMS